MTEKPFSFSIKVVIRDSQGRILLIRRSASSHGNPGKWEFPGGKADPGESFDKALLREVDEETGLHIRLQHVVGATEMELPERKIAYLLMDASLESGTVRLSDEHEAFEWVSSSGLLPRDMVPQFIPFAKSLSVT
jgi:8-oxo-dGTP diphosphatase